MEITGKILKIRYFNPENNFAIVLAEIQKKDRDFSVGKKETVKGYFPVCKEGDIFVANVERENVKYYGKTLYSTKMIKIELPSEANDLKDFFLEIDGVGPTDANKIIKKLGVTAIDKINKNKLMLARIGVSKKNRTAIINKCKLYSEITELSAFATTLNIRVSKILVLYDLWGTSTAYNINHNIYNAIAETDEISLYEADLITIAKNKSKVSRERISGAIISYMRFQEKYFGNIYTTNKKILNNLVKYMNEYGAVEKEFNVTIEKKLIMSCLNDLETTGTLKAIRKKNGKILYIRKVIYNTEKLVAKNIVNFIEENEFPRYEIFKPKTQIKSIENLDKTQKMAILNAVQYPISIITGGPGTGKSFTASELIKFFERNGLYSLITATTGKAASKLYENTGIDSYTIHSRIVSAKNFEGKNILIIDEFSMTDLSLMNDIFKILKYQPDYHIVIVGDIDQLPPVGVGDMLNSLIESDLIPVTYLEKIYRQGEGSEIISLAKDIKDSKDIELNSYGDEIQAIESKTDDIKRNVYKLYKNLRKKYSLHEIAVLTPINGHEIGVESLNDYLAPKLNLDRRKYPDEFVMSGNSEYFYENDRVMQTKNSKKLGVVNGEVGTIIQIDYENDGATVEYSDGAYDVKEVIYNKEDLNNIQLANAMSVHKSQGSEYKAVIIISDSLAEGIMSKKLIYTGVTRTKIKLFVVGDIGLFQKSAKKKTRERNELLHLFIKKYHKEYCLKNNIEY